MAGSWKDGLARAYIDLVDLFKRGDTDAARALLIQISGDFQRAAQDAWTQGRARASAGDHHGALDSFGSLLELHHENLLNIALSIDKPACFTAIAEVLGAMDLPLAADAATRLAARSGDSFYRPPASCQVSVLGGLYEVLFGERADGTFVEVGAYDGETFSNTSFLADLGWRGVYVEPVDHLFEKCRARHARNPRVTVLNAAIGASAGSIKFWDFGASSRNVPDPLLPGGTQGAPDRVSGRELVVPQRRLDTVLTESGIVPGFELLVVDVEGMEEAVFASFELAHWRPRCLIVELIDQAPQYAGHADAVAVSRRVRAALRGAGYDEVYRDIGNTVFRIAAG